jgi:hypothetical protein
MNYRQYRKALISITNGSIPRRILRQKHRAWRSFLRISKEEKIPFRDPLDVVFGVIR